MRSSPAPYSTSTLSRFSSDTCRVYDAVCQSCAPSGAQASSSMSVAVAAMPMRSTAWRRAAWAAAAVIVSDTGVLREEVLFRRTTAADRLLAAARDEHGTETDRDERDRADDAEEHQDGG